MTWQVCRIIVRIGHIDVFMTCISRYELRDVEFILILPLSPILLTRFM
jgi:hypothetical protein